MKRFFFVILSLLAFKQSLPGQESRLYLELGGSAGLGSVNFERTFVQGERGALAWRVGLSGFYGDASTGFSFIVPLVLYYYHGEGPHKVEIGLGQGVTLGLKGGIFFQTIPILGYRWQPEDRKLFLRFTYTPLVSYLIDFQWRHWFGISIGTRL